MSIWVKDPADVAWFQFDWTVHLATGETITTYTITCDAALTKESDSKQGAGASIQVSGGTSGTASLISCDITTSAGNELHADKHIYITDRNLDHL